MKLKRENICVCHRGRSPQQCVSWLIFDSACLCSRSGFKTAGWKTNASVWRWRGLTPPTRPSTRTWWAMRQPQGTCPTLSHHTCRCLITPTWALELVRHPRPPRSPTPCAPSTVSGCCHIRTRGRSCCAPLGIRPCTPVRLTAWVLEGVPVPAWRVTPANPTASQRDPPPRTSLALQRAGLTLLSLSRLQFSVNPHRWH